MRTAILAAALLLAACARPEPQSAAEQCRMDARGVVAAWPCMRGVVAAAQIPSDVKQTYLATGDYAAEEVRAGRMSDTQAKMVIARARQSANDAIAARASADSDPVADYLVLRRYFPR